MTTDGSLPCGQCGRPACRIGRPYCDECDQAFLRIRQPRPSAPTPGGPMTSAPRLVPMTREQREAALRGANLLIPSGATDHLLALVAAFDAASPVAPRDADPPNDTSSEGGKLRLEDVPPEMRDLIERDQAEQHERDRAEFDRRMAERDLAHLRHANEIAEALAAHRERAASPVAPRDADHISIPRDIVPLIAAIVLCPMCGGNGGGADGEDEPGMNCDGCYPDRKVLRAALAAADHKEERCLDCRYFASGRIEACEACAALAAQGKEA